ncbi:PAS domain-containing protein [Mucilaginibacter sp. 21P]|uniref:ATP-binding protein n=1 Tax=Mucilaginibacter sp. 21P TaxID=2778902 RepID=UPI001C5A19AE|nr:ATP-binding protein [Mucilaginibacter sp. 21P]QXV64024.1 PAS domain-containing protein [Mucilaginibacter sp. 21P]
MFENSRATREGERLEALKAYHILDTASEQDFDELAELASTICQTPIAILGFLDGERHWFKAKKGTELTASPQNMSFCVHTIATSEDILVVEDAKKDPRFASNPAAKALDLQFYAGVPLTNNEGHALGTLCVFDHTSRQLSDAQRTALKLLGRQAVDKLELRRKIFDLEAAKNEILELNKQMADQSDELQTFNEETAAINEELATINEELRSTNEELLSTQEQLLSSQQRLQLITDNITQLVWMAEPTGEIYWYNERWYAYTGTTPEEMAGWGWQRVHHQDHVVKVTEKYKTCMADGVLWEDTFPLRSAEGEYRWFLSRAVPFKDETGKILHWFGTNTDVTAQREDEQRKNDFISMVSHELKTPLTSTMAYVQVAQSKLNKQGDRSTAHMMDRSLKQLSKMTIMINGFLNVAKLESGQMHIQPSDFDLRELLIELQEEQLSLSPSHVFKFMLPESVIISADRDKIGQVVTNLISNAVKYSPLGSTVQVSCDIYASKVRINVNDQGMGIPLSEQPFLFDRFYRMQGEHLKYISGFGIGLYLCKEIVERHHGAIGVNSTLGSGSVFWFELPKLPSDQQYLSVL